VEIQKSLGYIPGEIAFFDDMGVYARPDVLILDEPTRGLGPLMQSRFVELVAEERERSKTILMN
jgi:ABC-type branched-subunit amino acid transport system ATPase component